MPFIINHCDFVYVDAAKLFCCFKYYIHIACGAVIPHRSIVFFLMENLVIISIIVNVETITEVTLLERDILCMYMYL